MIRLSSAPAFRRWSRQVQMQKLVASYLARGIAIQVTRRIFFGPGNTDAIDWKLKRILTRMVSEYASSALKVLNIQVKTSGLSSDLHGRLLKTSSSSTSSARDGLMIVSNHLSYLDILILSSVAPMLFISSVEMRNTAFVGLMAELGGTLFVERRNRDKIKTEISEISEALSQGFNVVLFAEATSSNGESVLPFKRSMLTAAALSGAEILPLTINYRKLDGQAVNRSTRDRLCWYGDMTFLPHFQQVIANEQVLVELNFHPARSLKKDTDTKSVARDLHEIISSQFRPLV